MKEKTQKIIVELITYLLIAFSAFYLGMGQSIKNTQTECNTFIHDEIITDEVRKCLGDTSLITPEFINWSYIMDNHSLNTSTNEINKIGE